MVNRFSKEFLKYFPKEKAEAIEIEQEEVFEGAEVALRLVCKDGVVYPQALRVYKNGEPFNPFEGFDE